MKPLIAAVLTLTLSFSVLGNAADEGTTSLSKLAASKERIVATTTGFPIISTAIQGANKDVVIYVTPSCSTCIRLFNDMVLDRLLTNASFKNANISFVVVPRFDYDHRIIKNLFCINHEKAIISLSKYFGAAFLFAQNERGRMRRDSLTTLSVDTVHSLGVSDSSLKRCQENQAFDDAIRASWEHGWKRNPEQDWPLVVINAKSTKIKDIYALLIALEE